jgi:hypothetical protein
LGLDDLTCEKPKVSEKELNAIKSAYNLTFLNA